MKKYGRTDTNQDGIVSGLRKAGCSVQSLASVGDGCSDLLVGRAGQNYLLEVKDGSRPPSERKLTPKQVTWHENWRGTVSVVHDLEEALRAVGL